MNEDITEYLIRLAGGEREIVRAFRKQEEEEDGERDR